MKAMQTIINYIKSLQINQQIFYLTIVLATIPLLIISMIIYYASVQIVKKEYAESSQLILENLSFNIDQYLQSIETGALSIHLENDFQQTLEEWSKVNVDTDPYLNLQLETNLKKFISAINLSINDAVSVQIYSEQQVFHSDFFRYEVFEASQVEESVIYKKALEAKGNIILSRTHQSIYDSDDDAVISLARTINKIGSKQPLGVLVLNVQLNALHDILRLSETSNRNFIIMDSEASVIYASDKDIIDESMHLIGHNQKLTNVLASNDVENDLYVTVNHTPSFVNFVTSPYSDWTVIQYIDQAEMTKQASHLRTIFWILIVLSLITAFSFMIILQKRVTQPVIELSEKVDLIGKGDFTVQLKETDRLDEFGTLYKGFNRMTQDLANNVERSSILKTQQKVAHYSALKSQIHPHFLANALESIQMQAIINQQHDISEMIGLLGALFRKSIQSGKELVTLEEELSHIRLYIDVQQMRFGDKINYIEDIDERALGKGVLHFSLQPFVENAIIHGLEAQHEDGSICIRAEISGEHLLISIKDSGVGMDEENIKRINKQLQSNSEQLNDKHIGIKNVHDQIRYYFGEAYGVSIDNAIDKGTIVTLTLPIRELSKQED